MAIIKNPTIILGGGAYKVVWNQWFDKQYFAATQTQSGVTFTNNGDGSFTVDGTNTSSGIVNFVVNSYKIPIVNNHHYCLWCNDAFVLSSSVYIQDWNTGQFINTTPFRVFTGNTGNTSYFVLAVRANVTADNLTLFPKFIDLTEMFGSGNEPDTFTEFTSWLTENSVDYEGYIPYNVGELRTMTKPSWIS